MTQSSKSEYRSGMEKLDMPGRCSVLFIRVYLPGIWTLGKEDESGPGLRSGYGEAGKVLI